MQKKQTLKRSESVAFCGLAIALITIGAWVTVPLGPVPLTLQTMVLAFVVLLFPAREAVASVAGYVVLGALGVPVFSGFRGGVSTLVGSTGGYLVGFIVSALLMWALTGFARRNRWTLAVALAVSLLACYAFGTVWFVVVSVRAGKAMTFGTALSFCVLPYILPDAAKIWLAYFLSKRLKRFVKA